MSYDIYLKDRPGGDVIQLASPHLMTGGTYAAEYDSETGQWFPKPITDAWLNITYNYAKYYYEASEDDKRFIIPDAEGNEKNAGIRGIYGKTGLDSIPMLQDLIDRINAKYRSNGEWITQKRQVHVYYDSKGNEIDFYEYFKRTEECSIRLCMKYIYEGPVPDYWAATAGNAIRPLYQLLAFAKLRPDGIWDGD